MELIEQFVDAGSFYLNHNIIPIARFGELDTLQQMVQQGFNVDLKDEFGTTALHNASANGHMSSLLLRVMSRDCVEFLINSGSHLIPNDSGNTPLRSFFIRRVNNR